MKKISEAHKGFVYSFSVVAYVILIAAILQSGNAIFGSSTVLAPIALLLLLVISAAIVGSLIFGEPVYLLINGNKKEALRLAGYTGVMLIAETIVFLILVAIVK